MPTSVINLYHLGSDDKDYVYVGRAGRGMDGTFGNPYQIGRDGNREAVLAAFATYFEKRLDVDPVFRNKVLSLRGQRLACFCRPTKGFQSLVLCHAQIIAAWLDGIKPEDVT